MKLGLAVVTYNRISQLRTVVEAIERHTTADHYLVVGDDGSTDGTAQFLREKGITRIGLSNRGIAWNKNRALYALMTRTDAEVFILLEDDTVPNRPGWQFEWMRAAELYGYATYAHPKVAPGIVAGAGTVADPYGCRNITSQCAAVSRRAVEAVGYFDTRFKGYGIEDGEWTTRLRRAGFGLRNELGSGETTRTNLMLSGGVEVIASTSYRDNASVERNRAISAAMRNDPVPRAAWVDEAERTALAEELEAGLEAVPLRLRPGAGAAGGAEPYPYRRAVARELARQASIAAAGRDPSAGLGAPIAPDTVAGDPPSLQRQQERWSGLAGVPVLVVPAGCDPAVVALAALNRFALAFADAAAAAASGFAAVDEVRAGDADDLAGHLDANFDRAMDDFVPVAVSQASPWPPTDAALRAMFAPEGRLPLLVSTLQDVAKIGVVGNVGDNFGLHAVRRLTDLEVEPLGLGADKRARVMLSIGSFIQHARDRAVVWGTGAVAAEPWDEAAKWTGSIFLGVRGPRTREHLLRRFGLAVPVIGDPGMLLPEIVAAERGTPEFEVGFILHGLDREAFASRAGRGHFLVENRTSPEALVRDIGRCRRIVTSSLHGWIFSQALGVPSVPVNISDRIPGGEFEFVDYAQSLGNYAFRSRVDLRGTHSLEGTDWAGLVDRLHRPMTGSTAAMKAAFPFGRVAVAA